MGVAELVDNLHVAMAKQARINSGTQTKPRPRPKVAEQEDGSHKLAHERLPINLGAAAALADLESYLGTWAMDVTDERWWPAPGEFTAVSAADALLEHIPEIRRHGAVTDLIEEISKVIDKGRKIIDRPQDLRYVGPCLAPTEQSPCSNDLYAAPGTKDVRCDKCGTKHEVADRPRELLEQSEDYIVTVREASQYIGYFGGTAVNQKTIRTWIDRKLLATRPGPTEERHIRLGDLYALLADRAEKAEKRMSA
jgi:hypothetical protein